MPVQLDSQTRALLWTAKVSARNLRAHVVRLKDCSSSEVTSRLKHISSEAEILSKSAEKLGKIDLPSENARDDVPPQDDSVLVLAKVLNAVASGAMKACKVCGKFVDGGGGHERIEPDPAQPDDSAKLRARQAAANQ